MTARHIGTWVLAVLCSNVVLAGAEVPPYNRVEDVIYGRKDGTALTLDVFTPRGPANGAAVVFVVSGGWVSSHEGINPQMFAELLKRGYTVFPVVHGSQPRYTIPEVVEDMHRSIRFIRMNAARYGIHPNRIGIMGGSAGGHLSLMIGTSGTPGRADAKDPVNRFSSRVQAVACFFPPTDFLNYGEEGRDAFVALEGELKSFRAPFDFRELDKETRRYVPITDRERRLEILRRISPVTHVSADDPPTLIIHGDADKLVPVQQAREIEEQLSAAGVPVKLVVKKDAGHGWPNLLEDVKPMADWFDKYLQNGHAATRPATRPGE